MTDDAGRGGRRPPQRGLHTLRDVQGDGGASHSHGPSDDSDDEQDLFAGGEKSALAVQNPGNPRDQINSIIDRARRNVPRPGGDDAPPARTRFTGAGQTLGGDDTPSETIPDPAASLAPAAPRVQRTLHLWRDGFSVDDGPLHRFDDPANAATLALINQGRAPLDILDVEHGQEVDLEVQQHRDEAYTRPKGKYKAFSGAGQRLGSPTPGAGPSVPPASAPPAGASANASASSGAETSGSSSSVAVDDSQPTVTLQVRLGDGTRLQSRFNTTHTVGDVYDFVDAASPASTQRAYALMTTFPSRELTDKAVVLGEIAEFKRGGVVVQKWK